MLGPLRTLLLVAALALGPLASVASADTGCGGAGRPACTILRPPPAPNERAVDLGAGPCVVIIGGLGSTPKKVDAVFAPLLQGLDGIRVHRFDYDALGPIAPAARALVRTIRDLAATCGDVHVLAHSMGGVVADRAFSLGLSGADGIATYMPFASPHNGATLARELCGIGDVDPTFTDALRAIASAASMPDPTSAAVCDLASVRPPRAVRGVSTARLRLVNDPLVLRRDHVAHGRNVREFLPESHGELEGHGGITSAERAKWTVERAIVDGAVPPDDRPALYRLAAAQASLDIDRLLAAAFASAGDALWFGALETRLANIVREAVEAAWEALRPPTT